MSNLIEISIIIPIFNKWAFTKSCLEDLFKLNSSQVEIIIVDNASSDETKQEIVKFQSKMPNLKVIHNEINYGFGAACNIAYMNSSAQNVLFLNNDIRVKANHDNWINIIINACDTNSIIGPTGGKVDLDNNFQFLYETNDPNKSINYMSGWCLGGSKKVFDKFIETDNPFKGPFSKNYFCYFEDTHLGFMASKLGIQFKMIQVPVVHFGKISSKQLNTYDLYIKSKTIFNKIWNGKN